LAVGCLEDKIVQTLVARILEALFEPVFLAAKLRLRRGKSAHQAVGRLHETIRDRSDNCIVVEMDIEKFFDSMDHDWLVQKLRDENRRPALPPLDSPALRSSLLTEDGVKMSEVGTAPRFSGQPQYWQTSACTSCLDEWFREHFGAVGRMVRYADDAVFVFADEATAETFRQALALDSPSWAPLNLDKSGIVPFRKSNPEEPSPFSASNSTGVAMLRVVRR